MTIYKLKSGTYKRLVEKGWNSYVPADIDGQYVEITNNYMNQPEPHMEVKLVNSIDATPFGVPNDCLKLA